MRLINNADYQVDIGMSPRIDSQPHTIFEVGLICILIITSNLRYVYDFF